MATEVSGRDDMRFTLCGKDGTIHFLREYIMKSPHKHHIIPKYHCEELGIDPDFDDNFVTIERDEHAQIHWEYYNGGYETLLKYIKPKPYVLINIPFGDKRDMWAASINAKGEIDGIDMSGENSPLYKHGRACLVTHPITGGKQAPRAYKNQHRAENVERYRELERIRSRRRLAKKKAERQGVGTLDAFLK